MKEKNEKKKNRVIIFNFLRAHLILVGMFIRVLKKHVSKSVPMYEEPQT